MSSSSLAFMLASWGFIIFLATLSVGTILMKSKKKG